MQGEGGGGLGVPPPPLSKDFFFFFLSMSGNLTQHFEKEKQKWRSPPAHQLLRPGTESFKASMNATPPPPPPHTHPHLEKKCAYATVFNHDIVNVAAQIHHIFDISLDIRCTVCKSRWDWMWRCGSWQGHLIIYTCIWFVQHLYNVCFMQYIMLI